MAEPVNAQPTPATLTERVAEVEFDFTKLAYLARAMAAEGCLRAEVLAAFEARRARADEAADQATVDRLCDVMDHLTGFCSPHNLIAFADDASVPGGEQDGDDD